MKTLHPLSVPTSPYFIRQDSMIVSPVFVVCVILIVYVELRDQEICGMLPNETGRVSWKVGVRARIKSTPSHDGVELPPKFLLNSFHSKFLLRTKYLFLFFVCYSQSIPFILSSIASLNSSFQALPWSEGTWMIRGAVSGFQCSIQSCRIDNYFFERHT